MTTLQGYQCAMTPGIIIPVETTVVAQEDEYSPTPIDTPVINTITETHIPSSSVTAAPITNNYFYDNSTANKTEITTPPEKKGKGGLTKGELAGIIVGSVVGTFTIIGVLIQCCCRDWCIGVCCVYGCFVFVHVGLWGWLSCFWLMALLLGLLYTARKKLEFGVSNCGSYWTWWLEWMCVSGFKTNIILMMWDMPYDKKRISLNRTCHVLLKRVDSNLWLHNEDSLLLSGSVHIVFGQIDVWSFWGSYLDCRQRQAYFWLRRISSLQLRTGDVNDQSNADHVFDQLQ